MPARTVNIERQNESIDLQPQNIQDLEGRTSAAFEGKSNLFQKQPSLMLTKQTTGINYDKNGFSLPPLTQFDRGII